jgi:TrmH family RNA methyltransferase
MPRAETLRSRANPLYKRLRALKERAGERELCLLEGPRLVLEALEAGLAVVEAAASERAEASPAGGTALAELRQRGVPVRMMASELVASLSETETSQGVLALARRPSFPEEGIFRGTPLVLVADGVQNPGNLGGLLRTAEAAGVAAVVAADPVTDWGNPNVVRASKGTVFAVPVASATTREVLQWLAANEIRLIVTTPETELLHTDVDYTGRVAIAVGSEKHGVDDLLLSAATHRVRIPMHGRANSLNVAASAAIVLYEAVRQRYLP